MKDPNCAYCMQGELVAKFGYPVCEMETGFYIYLRNRANAAESFSRTKTMSVR